MERLRFQPRPAAVTKAAIPHSDGVEIRNGPRMRQEVKVSRLNGRKMVGGNVPVWVLAEQLWPFPWRGRKITAGLSVFLDSSSHVWAEVLPDGLGAAQERLCAFPSLPL